MESKQNKMTKRHGLFKILGLGFLALFSSWISLRGSKENRTSFDLVITNARIIDGTGNPWYRGDIGIRGERIASIGRLGQAESKRRIDAGDKVVCPGFIDMMGASDWTLLVDPRCASKVTQGITLIVSGEGHSVAPVNQKMLAEMKPIFEQYKLSADWRTLEDFFRRLEANPPAINFATFVGSGGLREMAIGRENRPATPSELAAMEKLLADAMEQGAFGLSSALMYVPDRFNSTEELIALARVAARYHGPYVTHQRNESNSIEQSLDEVFRIAKEALIPTHIYHLKTAYIQNWNKMPTIIEKISMAQKGGLDITACVYPYIAASFGLVAVLPPWAQEGGMAEIRERLKNSAVRERIKTELAKDSLGWENEYYGTGGGKGLIISNVINKNLKGLVGRKLSDIAQEKGKDPRDVLLDIILEDNGMTSIISFIMSEESVKLALKQSWAAFCTDSEIAAPDGPLSSSLIHPRAYGTYPRILGHYVREENIMSLEDAVRKASSLTAQVLGIRDRGLLKEDFYADIVIFDPKTIIDKATFEQPHQYSQGIEYVLVNGKVVVDRGMITNIRPGKVLRGPGYRKS
jgi:N-acyl-D-amino-acid deacylase